MATVKPHAHKDQNSATPLGTAVVGGDRKSAKIQAETLLRQNTFEPEAERSRIHSFRMNTDQGGRKRLTTNQGVEDNEPQYDTPRGRRTYNCLLFFTVGQANRNFNATNEALRILGRLRRCSKALVQ
mmetsp:Transcript_19210/g.76961  ORF Transcript_19210/g.76961 Transcript_19210/m.76961 type:complete len:127 (-) Transcript_19210:194-574(-)